MKGKSLEDINQLFEDRVSIMQFGKTSLTKRDVDAEGTTLEFKEGKKEAATSEIEQVSTVTIKRYPALALYVT